MRRSRPRQGDRMAEPEPARGKIVGPSDKINIPTDLLRTFAFIAEEGSFTRAAERVGRTQSAVSMQVQRLEQMLGQRVLLRGKGGSVQLTPHGQYLLERSRQRWARHLHPDLPVTVRQVIPAPSVREVHCTYSSDPHCPEPGCAPATRRR